MDSDNPAEAISLDNNQIVRHVFNIAMLDDLLLGKGGNAGKLLQKLLKGTNGLALPSDYDTEMLKAWCDSYGPVVVAGFVVDGVIKDCYRNESMRRCDDGEMLQLDIDEHGAESFGKITLPGLPHTGAMPPEQPVISSVGSDESLGLSLAASEIPDLAWRVSSESTELDETPHASSKSAELDEELHDGVDDELDGGVSEELDGHDTLTHAMVVIGYRTDAVGKVWFLIQNTWFGMVLFEVSGDYLKSHMSRTCPGILVAIVKKLKQRKILLPEKFTFLTENDAKILDGGVDGCDIAHDYIDSMFYDGL
jgi:hypothetical protein